MTMPPSIFTVTNETQLYAREERGVSGQEENWKKWRKCCNSVFFCFFFSNLSWTLIDQVSIIASVTHKGVTSSFINVLILKPL